MLWPRARTRRSASRRSSTPTALKWVDDKFDEVVSAFLVKIGEANIISITTLTYTHLDIGSQKLMTDFGVMIVYRG